MGIVVGTSIPDTDSNQLPPRPSRRHLYGRFDFIYYMTLNDFNETKIFFSDQISC